MYTSFMKVPKSLVSNSLLSQSQSQRFLSLGQIKRILHDILHKTGGLKKYLLPFVQYYGGLFLRKWL